MENIDAVSGAVIEASVSTLRRMYAGVVKWSLKPMVLRNFQEELEKIPAMDAPERDALVTEIVEVANCADVLVVDDNFSEFIHQYMIDVARVLWKCAYVMFENVDMKTAQKNKATLEGIVDICFRTRLQKWRNNRATFGTDGAEEQEVVADSEPEDDVPGGEEAVAEAADDVAEAAAPPPDTAAVCARPTDEVAVCARPTAEPPLVAEVAESVFFEDDDDELFEV
jgi:hypothetical protein